MALLNSVDEEARTNLVICEEISFICRVLKVLHPIEKVKAKAWLNFESNS